MSKKIIIFIASLLLLSCATTYEPQNEGERRIVGTNFNPQNDKSCYNDTTLIEAADANLAFSQKTKFLPWNIIQGTHDISEYAFTCYTEFGILYMWQTWYSSVGNLGIPIHYIYPIRLQTDKQLDERAKKYCERELNKIAVYQGPVKEWGESVPDWILSDMVTGREYFCK